MEDRYQQRTGHQRGTLIPEPGAAARMHERRRERINVFGKTPDDRVKPDPAIFFRKDTPFLGRHVSALTARCH